MYEREKQKDREGRKHGKKERISISHPQILKYGLVLGEGVCVMTQRL